MTETTGKESLEKLLDKDEPYFRPTKMQARKVGMVDCGDHAPLSKKGTVNVYPCQRLAIP